MYLINQIGWISIVQNRKVKFKSNQLEYSPLSQEIEFPNCIWIKDSQEGDVDGERRGGAHG